MKKVYSSKSHISINIVLPSGKSMRVSFMPLSGGSSYFITSDKDIQKAIEQHYKFNSLFFLTETVDEQVEQKAKTKEKSSEQPSDKIKVQVSDINAAKDYLADKFGVSRTLLRMEKQILTHAELNGVEFIFE